MRYFDDIKTLQGLRKRYAALVKKHHPDIPGNNTEKNQNIMSDINAQYTEKKEFLLNNNAGATENRVSSGKTQQEPAENPKKKRKGVVSRVADNLTHEDKNEIIEAGGNFVKTILNKTVVAVVNSFKKE